MDSSFREGREGSEYATAVMLSFFRKKNQLAFTKAGHPPPLMAFLRSSDKGVEATLAEPGTVPRP